MAELFDKAPEAVTIPEGLEVSACLVSYARRDNMPGIVESLLAHPFITDIVVVNCHPETIDHLKWPAPGKKRRLEIVQAPTNLFTFGRFYASQCALNQVCYTQDDDCIVENVPELVRTFCTQARPRQIVHALMPSHIPQRSENIFEGRFHAALLGWGSVWLREWWRTAYRAWEACHGLEIPSQATESNPFFRKADRVFSILQGREHITVPAIVKRLDDEANALSSRKDHQAMNELADRMAIEAFKEWESSR